MFQKRKPGSYVPRSSRYKETPVLLPPATATLGQRPFNLSEKKLLASQLQAAGWPRDTLNIHALEGYLCALLVLPIQLQPGAWLPPIWNLGGWKIPPPINNPESYAVFMELVFGFLRTLDQALLATPPKFESIMQLQLDDTRVPTKTLIPLWVYGFSRGLALYQKTGNAPTTSTQDAVRRIAIYSPHQSNLTDSETQYALRNLTRAVLSLASTRSSRGPLGALDRPVVPAVINA